MFVQIADRQGSGSGGQGLALPTLPHRAGPSLEGRQDSTGAAPFPGRVDAAAVRVRSARIADMRQVEPLINGFARKNLMLPKSHDQLARMFREFVVAVDEHDRVLGCGALRIYNEVLAEIASLAVDEQAHGLGIGRQVVARLLEEARQLNLSTVFALTLQDEFFHRLGFRTVPKESFPLKVWADCRNCPKLHACDEIAVARDV